MVIKRIKISKSIYWHIALLKSFKETKNFNTHFAADKCKLSYGRFSTKAVHVLYRDVKLQVDL